MTPTPRERAEKTVDGVIFVTEQLEEEIKQRVIHAITDAVKDKEEELKRPFESPLHCPCGACHEVRKESAIQDAVAEEREAIEKLIKDDSAITYQSMRHYRSCLIKAIRERGKP